METQELRTRVVWDTADAEKGAQRVARAFERVGAAEKNASKGGGFKGAAASMASDRFGGSQLARNLKMGGPALAAGGLAVAALAVAWKKYENNAEEAAKANERLEQSFLKVNRASTFATSGIGAEGLTGQLDATREQTAGDRELSDKLKGMQDLRDSNIFTKALFGSVDTFRSSALGGGKQTTDEAKQTADLRLRATGQDQTKLRGLRSKAYGEDADIAEMNGPGSNPLDARLKELDIQKELALNAAKMAESGKEDLNNIERKFGALRKQVQAEKDVQKARQRSAATSLATDGGPMSGSKKTLQKSYDDIKAGEVLINSGNLTEQEKAEERLKITAAQNTAKEALMDRRLNPDGTRKRSGQLRQEERAERKEEKARQRFLDKVDSGAIDMRTGKNITVHKGTGGQPMAPRAETVLRDKRGNITGRSENSGPYNFSNLDAIQSETVSSMMGGGIGSHAFGGLESFKNNQNVLRDEAIATHKGKATPPGGDEEKGIPGIYKILNDRLPKAG